MNPFVRLMLTVTSYWRRQKKTESWMKSPRKSSCHQGLPPPPHPGNNYGFPLDAPESQSNDGYGPPIVPKAGSDICSFASVDSLGS